MKVAGKILEKIRSSKANIQETKANSKYHLECYTKPLAEQLISHNNQSIARNTERGNKIPAAYISSFPHILTLYTEK